jgi:NADH:ubiquinone oxidoreductase subunit 4 (subunit M)
MMIELALALLALPLFPASLLVNAVLQALPVWLRIPALLALPITGALLLGMVPVPAAPLAPALSALAAFTALLYAWRLLAVRELFIWARLQATSAWPLVWLAWLHGMQSDRLVAVAVALTAPAAVLMVLASALRRRLGAAYLGLQGRIAPAYPRLAGAWVVALLAALAAPPFPGFFALLAVLRQLPALLALAVLVVWLVWSWAAAVLWQHALFGPQQPRAEDTADLSRGAVLIWVLLALAAMAVGLIGGWGWSMH